MTDQTAQKCRLIRVFGLFAYGVTFRGTFSAASDTDYITAVNQNKLDIITQITGGGRLSNKSNNQLAISNLQLFSILLKSSESDMTVLVSNATVTKPHCTELYHSHSVLGSECLYYY